MGASELKSPTGRVSCPGPGGNRGVPEDNVNKELLSTADLIRLEEAHGAHNYHPLDVVINRAQGVWVWDVEGNKYLDFLAAYSAVNQGHCHPRIIAALKEQADKVTLTSRAFRNDQLGPLCAEITRLSGYSRFLPMNSGAEAVETAIKAPASGRTRSRSRRGPRRDHRLFGNFHGRTTTIVSSTDEQYRDGFGSFTPGSASSVRRHRRGNEGHQRRDNRCHRGADPGRKRTVSPDRGSRPAARGDCRSSGAFDDRRNPIGTGRTGKLSATSTPIRPDIVIIGGLWRAAYRSRASWRTMRSWCVRQATTGPFRQPAGVRGGTGCDAVIVEKA